jgi:NAD(P)-dependent dehydrogenase (short-subunit alcohol dehydrogenase family)
MLRDENARRPGTCAGWFAFRRRGNLLSMDDHAATGLRDKVALVTGASSGIGRATAVRLARLGAHVGLAARTAKALEEVAGEVERAGRQALVLPTDVTDPEQCRLAVARTAERFGRLDVLVCSAGVSMRSRFEETDLGAMERVMRVNFFGTLYPTWHAVPHVKATRGSLVAVSSLVGKRGTPTYSAYGASKFAVQGLYESLRLELAADGVHVGVVSPGHVGTPLRERVLGPDGRPWPTPPPAPFRVWPVELVVDRLVRLILGRRPEALLPGFVGPLLALDQVLGPWLGDRIIARQFRKNPLPLASGGLYARRPDRRDEPGGSPAPQP